MSQGFQWNVLKNGKMGGPTLFLEESGKTGKASLRQSWLSLYLKGV